MAGLDAVLVDGEASGLWSLEAILPSSILAGVGLKGCAPASRDEECRSLVRPESSWADSPGSDGRDSRRSSRRSRRSTSAARSVWSARACSSASISSASSRYPSLRRRDRYRSTSPETSSPSRTLRGVAPAAARKSAHRASLTRMRAGWSRSAGFCAVPRRCDRGLLRHARRHSHRGSGRRPPASSRPDWRPRSRSGSRWWRRADRVEASEAHLTEPRTTPLASGSP